MSLETFSNDPVTTVTSGGTDAPAAGTTQTWTVASSAAFPAASSAAGPPTQFHVADPLLPGEVIAVTDASGTSWIVTRGAEGTVPVAHAAGFSVEQVVTAGAFGNFVQDATVLSGDLSGTLPSPEVTGITGVAVTGTPEAGAVIYATSPSTAQWTADPPGFLTPAAQLGGDLSGTPADAEVTGIGGSRVAAPPGGTGSYLRGDGTWGAPEAPPFLPSDLGLLGCNYDPATASASSAPNPGTVLLTAVSLRRAATVTNVLVYAVTGGSGLAAGSCASGLYDSTGALVGKTADQSAAWQTAGLMTMPLSGGPYPLAAGRYWVAVLGTGTALPALLRVQAPATALSVDLGGPVTTARSAVNGTGLTALPAQISPAANAHSGQMWWAGLS